MYLQQKNDFQFTEIFSEQSSNHICLQAALFLNLNIPYKTHQSDLQVNVTSNEICHPFAPDIAYKF